MKQTTVLILLLFLVPPQQTQSCALYGGELWPPITAFEQEPFVRVGIYLPSKPSQPVLIQYATEDGGPALLSGFSPGIAHAGVDYVPSEGSLTFAPGQTEAFIDIPLIDNGVRDGPRDFQVLIAGAEFNGGISPEQKIWIRIEDNELGSEVDPLFLPPILADVNRSIFLGILPDGRWIAEEAGSWSSSASPQPLRVFEADGREDVNFGVNLIRSRSREGLGILSFRTASADGSIIALDFPLSPNERPVRIVRLNPDGTIRWASPAPGPILSVPGVQSDGKLLLVVTEGPITSPVRFTLIRLQLDGTRDTTFHEAVLAMNPSQILIDASDRILIAAGYATTEPRLWRLHPDGTLDAGFPVASVRGTIERLSELGDSSLLLLQSDFEPMHLGPGGEVIPFAGRVLPIINGQSLWPVAQAPDGALLGSTWASFEAGVVVRRPSDSAVNSVLTRVRLPVLRGNCGFYFQPEPPPLAWSPSGLLIAKVTEVEGMPCRGVARLRMNPPEKEFRVLTPIESPRSSGVARLQIVRAGPTTNPASVSFRTLDRTAKGNTDFVPSSGRLDFASFEVRKDLSIRLLPDRGAEQRLTFGLALSDASEGYRLVAETPVVVSPDLHLTIEAQPSEDLGPKIAVAIRGTQPGYDYVLQSSTDLIRWEPWKQITATNVIANAGPLDTSTKRVFFRVAN